MRKPCLVIGALTVLWLGVSAARADGDPIGSVDTAFKLIGRNHQIRVSPMNSVTAVPLYDGAR